MIRAQRKAHLRIWTLLAVALPLAAVLILTQAASTVIERAPVQLAPPASEGGLEG